jgi:hypothetical protein
MVVRTGSRSPQVVPPYWALPCVTGRQGPPHLPAPHGRPADNYRRHTLTFSVDNNGAPSGPFTYDGTHV